MKKPLFIVFSLILCLKGLGQDIMTVLPDSASLLSNENLVEFRFFAGDFATRNINEDLNFTYYSQNSGYKLSHDMNVKGINNIPNVGFGVEEDMGKHLLINFFNITGGYISNTWQLTVNAGVGYSLSLDKKKNFRIRGTFNLIYEYLSYGLGTYTDTTLEGFDIDGANIGTYVNNVKYVNSSFGVSPGLDFLYRRNNFDFFLNASYNYTLLDGEKINFYRTSIPPGLAIYDGMNPVNGGILKPGSYIIELGIIKEFGL
jgi:hypothetical protein